MAYYRQSKLSIVILASLFLAAWTPEFSLTQAYLKEGSVHMGIHDDAEFEENANKDREEV